MKKLKAVSMLLGGGMLLGTGSCLPDNFWVNLGDNAANTAVSQVVAAIVGLVFP